MTAAFAGNRDQTFTWLRSYLDFSDATVAMRDADNSNQEIMQSAPDAPVRPGYVHVRNCRNGTYEAGFEPAVPGPVIKEGTS